VWRFLLIAGGVFLCSTIIYKVGLEYWHTLGREGYSLGEQGLATIAQEPLQVLWRVVNPLAYWSAFKLWTYPFPFHYMPPLWTAERLLAYVVLAGWLGIVLAAVTSEIQANRQQWPQVLLKWLSVAVCLGFGALFLIADSPLEAKEHRPHLTMTFSGVVIFSGAYSLQVLGQRYRVLSSSFCKASAIILVVMIAFGAQAGVLRGVVHNRLLQLEFIRTELMAKDPATYTNVIVVVPEWQGGCLTEPCDIWLGQMMDGIRDLSRPGVYRYALTTNGIGVADKQISVVKQVPDSVPADAVLIDWNKFIEARKRHAEFLRQ
jgi:hypothetical protein